MKPITLVVLLALLAIAGAAAFFTTRAKSGGSEAGNVAAVSLAPDLRARINDVSSIAVKTAKGETVIEKRAGTGTAAPTWVNASLGGFPVDGGKVKEAVLSIAELKASETRTSKAENHARLGVEDAPAGESVGRIITIKDGAGAVLASVVIGKTAEGPRDGGRSWVFARRAGDPQSYLAEGGPDPTVSIPADSMGWIDRNVMQLDSTRVRGTMIMPAPTEGMPQQELIVQRASLAETTYDVKPMPEGRALLSPSAGTQVASALSFLSLDAVAPAASLDGMPPAGESTFRTFDGLVIHLAHFLKDGKTWTRMNATFEAPDPALTEDELKANVTLKKAEDVAKEAADLNAKLSAWAFQFPDFKLKQFQTTIDTLLAPIEQSPIDAAIDGTIDSDEPMVK